MSFDEEPDYSYHELQRKEYDPSDPDVERKKNHASFIPEGWTREDWEFMLAEYEDPETMFDYWDRLMREGY